MKNSSKIVINEDFSIKISFFSRECDRSHQDASFGIKMLESSISFDKPIRSTIKTSKNHQISRVGLREGLKINSYLLIGSSERTKNLVLTITFYALSNGQAHFKIKILPYAGL
jgi:hypothetical protein